MRYVYFIEGVCFVTMAYLLSPYFGFPSVIFSAIASNIMWSGTQGIRRTAARFKVSTWEIGGNWTRRPLSLLLVFWPIAMICWWWTRSLEPLMSIAVNASVALSAGGWAFWHCGLTQELQAQCKRAMARGREAIARKLSGDVH